MTGSMLTAHVMAGKSAEHQVPGWRSGQDVPGGMADAGQLDEPVPRRQPSGAGLASDMPVVVSPPLQPVRALGHRGGIYFEQERGAVAVLPPEHDRDIAGKVAPQALPGPAIDVRRRAVEPVPPLVNGRPVWHRVWPIVPEVQVGGRVRDDEPG